MNKQEWQNSSTALRKLIRDAFKEHQSGRDIDRMCVYKFGLVWNNRCRYFHVYNGVTKNTIATIRIVGDRSIVRYRKNSWYAGILETLTIPNRDVTFVESRNLARHANWVGDRVQRQVNRSMADFLAEEEARRIGHNRSERRRLRRELRRSQNGRTSTSPLGQYILSVPLHNIRHSQMAQLDSPYGDPSLTETVQIIQVHFDDAPSPMQQHEAGMLVQELQEAGRDLPHDINFSSLGEMYREMRNESERQRNQIAMAERMERIMRETPTMSYDYNQQTYYGRPMEQLRDYMSSTINEGSSITEESLMQAVRAMDEANVPYGQRSGYNTESIARLMSIDDVEPDLPF